MNEELVEQDPIITPQDQGRWPLMEVVSQECEFPLTDSDVSQIAKMDEVLTNLGDDAAGLAAVQIGYPRRIFVLNFGGENRVFINPEVVERSRDNKKDYEACLSLPGVGGRFGRPKWVELEYSSMDGEVQQERFKGFWSRAVMHEIDHLNGTLVVDRMRQAYKEPVSSRTFKNQVGNMEFTPQKMKAIKKRRAKRKRTGR